jgi:formate hydrogenlyase subunit 6/NADH:ubiquinone oxidoreductase subunit I
MPHHEKVNTMSGQGNLDAGDVPVINRDLCIACGSCVEFCPGGAVRIVDGKAAVVNAAACSYCTECEAICPTGAISCPFTVILVDKPLKQF